MKASEQPAYASSWYTDTKVGVPERGPLTSDLDVEVGVVGAGLAGLTAARELALRGWSVAVLEARQVAWSASGRNTGFVLPGFAQGIDTVVRRVGLDHAKQLWGLSEAGLEYVRSTIRETGMPGVDPVEGGWLKVAKTDVAEHDLALVQLLGQDIGAVVEGWPTERVRDVLKTDHYFHAIHVPNAFHIHALNYALGLAAAAEEAGARIFERTPVLSVDGEGVRKRITTPSGRVRCAHIVLAGNVHLGNVMPRVSGTLLPVWTYVATTAPLGERLAHVIGYPGGVSDTGLADNHYRVVGGDRLMWSGGLTTWEGNPKRFARRLKADIERLFPQLRPVEIEHVWTGVLGNALHRMPQIGELSPRVWLASGFGGHGLNTTAMAGNIVARGIDEGDDSWRLFLPFELVWAGGRIGRTAAQLHYWWSRSRERSKARQARNREAEYRRGETREVTRAGAVPARPSRRAAAKAPVAALAPAPAPAPISPPPAAAVAPVLPAAVAEPVIAEPLIAEPHMAEPVLPAAMAEAPIPAVEMDAPEVAAVATEPMNLTADAEPMAPATATEPVAPTTHAESVVPAVEPPEPEVPRHDVPRPQPSLPKVSPFMVPRHGAPRPHLIPDQEEPPPRSPETIAREPAAPTPAPEAEAAPAPAPAGTKTRYDWRGLLDPRKRR